MNSHTARDNCKYFFLSSNNWSINKDKVVPHRLHIVLKNKDSFETRSADQCSMREVRWKEKRNGERAATRLIPLALWQNRFNLLFLFIVTVVMFTGSNKKNIY